MCMLYTTDIMTSTLSLVRRATVLAGAGLAGLRNVSADEEADKATVRRCQESFAAYDDLVKAKCIIDLVTELPSYEEELGRYAASLDLCRSIISRAIQRQRQHLDTSAKRSREEDSDAILRPSGPVSKAVEVGSVCGSTLAGVAPAACTLASSSSFGTTPTSWAPADIAMFDSIVGNSAAKRTLFEHVVLPLKLSEEAREMLFAGIRSSGNNILLHGPPGTGKTSIAQAVAQEAGATFYSVTPSSILSKYQGESERVLHQLFDVARKSKPSIIFLDELDALAPSRDAQDDVQSRRLLAELLLQTSQLRPRDQVVVVGATNRIDDIDIALLRRFHGRIFIGPPNQKERADMILRFMANIEHSISQEQLSSLADRLPGWSGSDIKSLCKEACMGPVRYLYEQEHEIERMIAVQHASGRPLTLRPVEVSDYERAYSYLMGSSSSAPQYTDEVSDPVSDEVAIDDEIVNEELVDIQQRQCRQRGEGSEDEGDERDGRACAELHAQGAGFGAGGIGGHEPDMARVL